MKKIPINSWVRKKQYQFFKDYDMPFFNIVANVNVTKLYLFTKIKNISFFKSCLFLATKAANCTEEFRCRISDGGVVVYDQIHIGTTILKKDETFGFCYFNYDTRFTQFDKNASAAIEKQNSKISEQDEAMDENAGNDNIIRFSAIPWISFTSFTNARKLGSNDSIPIIVFGKYFQDFDVKKMPVSVEVHHALMDGIHVGKFFELFQTLLDMPELHIDIGEDDE